MFRKIIHIDMDAFFVAVEIRDNPTLANKPVAVGGSSRSRGVLSTCNYLARQYGLHSAMPTYTAVQKCPELIVVPGRMAAYKEASDKIRAIMLRYCDEIEPLSLDEAYLDVTNSPHCLGSATLIAQEIRQAIESELSLTASAGIAPIKYLAKVASDLNKPNGQYVIKPENMQGFIDQMPLNKIPGIGKVSYQKLLSHQLVNGLDIRQTNKKTLIESFGKQGLMLWQRCHGIDNRGIEASRQRKSVGVERTFDKDMKDITQLKDYLFDYLLPELKKRAEKHLLTRPIIKLGIKVKFSDFQQTTKECQFTCFDDEIYNQLLNDALERGQGKSVRLLGAHIALGDTLSKTLIKPLQYSLSLNVET